MNIHSFWFHSLRTPENDGFCRVAFDYVVTVVGEPCSSPVVGTGCGSDIKTMLPAQRGYRVAALDISNVTINQSRDTVAADGSEAMVEFAQADLTKPNLPRGSSPRVLCWGVLMRIPSVERVVGELASMHAPGGVLVLSEANFRSAQTVAMRWLKSILTKERAELVPTVADLGQWEHSSAGRLLTRQADIPWVIGEFERHGFVLQGRHAGQFTEVCALLSWRPLCMLVRAFNRAWFRWMSAGGPAFGNLLVSRKPA